MLRDEGVSLDEGSVPDWRSLALVRSDGRSGISLVLSHALLPVDRVIRRVVERSLNWCFRSACGLAGAKKKGWLAP